MKRIIIILFVLLGMFTVWYYGKNPLTTKIKLHNQIFFVDVAVTPKEKERGLSFRDSLAPNRGMLFIYDHKEQFAFWMKDMRFPIDIIWIDGKTVVDLTPNIPIPTSDELLVYRPRVAVDKVFEVPAGTIEKMGITIGDTLEILR